MTLCNSKSEEEETEEVNIHSTMKVKEHLMLDRDHKANGAPGMYQQVIR
jgi:hypothetical protein